MYKSDTETKTNGDNNEGDHNISTLLPNVNEIMHAYPPMSVLDSNLHEPARMMFSDEEGSMLATDEYFVSDNLEANNSPVNRMVIDTIARVVDV